MPRHRVTGTELAKLLHAMSQPVYVLDDERRLVFLNEACEAWLNAPGETLLGGVCRYHSEPTATPAEAALAGLCPSPAALAALLRQAAATAIVSAIDADGALHARRAAVVRLGGPPVDEIAAGATEGEAAHAAPAEANLASESAGLLVIVDGDNLPAATPEALAAAAAQVEAAGQDAVAAAAHQHGAAGEADLLHRALKAFHHRWARRLGAERLVGVSAAMQLVRRQVETAIGGQGSVLVVGPAGSGRQRVVEAIHYGDDPSAAPALVPLDCAALPPDLVLSTLAAFEAGSGVAALPPQSAVLLNNVDQLAPAAQEALSELLKPGSFPLRRMATAARPLMDLARDGRFREELAAELSTLVVALPPLRQRRVDLPLLAQAFVEALNAAGEKQIAGFSEAALDRLDAYDWPGETAELAALVEQAHRAAEGPQITPADLPEQLRLAAQAAAYPRKVEQRIVLDEFLAEVERELVQRALRQAKGNKAKAARLLGLTRPRLYRRMMQLGLGE